MTLADRLVDAILEYGPMPVCELATTVRKQKAEVIAALNGNPDVFVHNGLKARASRWDVRPEFRARADLPERSVRDIDVMWPPDYDDGEEALVTLVRQKLRTPEEALLLVVCAVNGAGAA